MPWIVTPRQLSQHAEFHHQLAQLLTAGLGVIQALEAISERPPSASFRAPLQRLLTRLGQGATFTDSIRSSGAWMPEFDLALLHAGEQSGRLPDCCRLLAGYYHERAALARSVLSELMYPLFVVHFALLVFPPHHLTELVKGTESIPAFLIGKLLMVLPCYAVVGVLLWAGQSGRSEAWRAVVEKVLGAVPILGNARRQLALSRLSAALEALLAAGVSIVEAWEIAARASGSPAMAGVVGPWRRQIETGRTPSDLVNASGFFPGVFANMYSTGEVSGKLEETLGRLHDLFAEESSRRLKDFSTWLPRLLYFLILIGIAWQIISFWTGYFKGIGDVLDA